MKKKLLIVVEAVLFVAVLVLGGNYLADARLSPELSQEEIAFLQSGMEAYGYSGDQFSAEAIYNRDERPIYMMGLSELGFVLYNRTTEKLQLCGEGNPFRDYMSNKKYFGGVISFYVELDGRLFDIDRGKYLD